MTPGLLGPNIALKTMWWSGGLFGRFDWGIPPNANWAADDANTNHVEVWRSGYRRAMHMNSREAS